ncbi:MAG TPA: transcriptional repressor LexA [Gemmatimonadales bacterium]|nr:transcriptional repressor LexA [Gemmatimonadales bacterium]
MLNDRAREILEFLRGFVRKRGMPPTIREIGQHFGIASTNGVRYYLDVLEESGYIRRNRKISRGLELVQPLGDTRSDMADAGIPLLGRVAAGAPILAEQNFESSLEPNRLFGDMKGLFALQVRGDSMVDAGILEGDYVVVRSQDRANAGEMIVALLEDEATVKYFRPRGERIELVPANSRYQPIPVARDAGFRILGVVKGVIRTVGR